MTEPVFEKTPDARIVRSAYDEIKAIQTLLSDVYRDAGDGRTLLRELVQNADDARASRLVFAVVEKGLPDPKNTLLKGPGLMVANNGPFCKVDQDALYHAIGDAKVADTEKVGRFGVGLKSVFHICEAYVYLGAEPSPLTLRPGSLNPWAGTGGIDNQDPLHPDWDTVEVDDAQVLLKVAQAMLGSFDRGLLLWLPLRLTEHLDRGGPGEQYGLGQSLWPPEQIVAWFEQPDSLTLLLAQCGDLRSIEALHSTEIPKLLSSRTTLMRVERPCFVKPRSWVGRHSDDRSTLTSPFFGTIVATGQEWSVAGVDAVGHEGLREIRMASDWPKDRVFAKGHADLVPRKALAHAALTVLHRPEAATGGVRLRWAVFLPLDDAPLAPSGPLVDTVDVPPSAGRWDIVMHGYYWPSHDRRSIPWVTDRADDGDDESSIRARWNRGVRDDLMLPLLPQALELAVRDVPQETARSLLVAVAGAETVKKHLPAVTKNHMLLPVVTEHGVRWNVRGTGETRVLAIPSWNDAPSSVRKAFTRQIAEAADLTFIDADSPRIGGRSSDWNSYWIGSLLRCVSVDLLRTPQGLAWVERCVGCVLERQRDDGDDEHPTCTAVVADWLAERIGKGALTATTNTRRALRDTWRRLYEHLPNEWLVHAPVPSQRAVAEIAAAGAVGAGLMPIPFGVPPEPDAVPRPAPDRMDGALRALGERLLRGEGTQRARDPRLVLAETLLAIRDERPLGSDLAQLPLIRALRLPEGVYDAWSTSELRRQAAERHVFARGNDAPAEQGDTEGVEIPLGLDGRARRAAGNPRQAVTELAGATGATFWLVRGMALATDADVPLVTDDALADALLHATAIANAPDSRIPLLKRLAQGEVSATVRRAMRVLLTGVMEGDLEEYDIYRVRPEDTQFDMNRKTLDILLRLLCRPWRAVEPKLVERIPPSLFERLRIRVVDPGVLQSLLQETLGASTVDWLGLEYTDVLHLLKHLHGTAEDDLKRWRALPLHRRSTGDRGRIDDQTARATGGCQLPTELAREVTLLNPEDEVNGLYLDLPQLDEDGVLRMMLDNEHPHRFTGQIIDRLRPEGDQTILPRDQTLRTQLTDRPWLPGCGTSHGVAPGQILCLPTELLDLVRPLVAALGEHRLSSQVAPDRWSVVKDVVHDILGQPGPGKQVERLADALDTSAVAGVSEGSYLILPRVDDVDDELIKDVFKSPLVNTHRGWEVIRTAAKAAGLRGGNVPRSVLCLARAFCERIPFDRQLSTLTSLAKSRRGKDSPTGRVFRRLVQKYAQTPGFFEHVLPHITLPTQGGAWRPTSEIARSPFGVARGHRVLEEYRADLRLDGRNDVVQPDASHVVPRTGPTADFVFDQYFKPWENRLKHSAVGAFLSLFGNGKDNAILLLAKKWLSEVDGDVATVRRELTGTDEEARCSTVPVFVQENRNERQVTAVNILGGSVEMAADGDNETIFATPPAVGVLESFWTVTLRQVKPTKHSAKELTDMLGRTIDMWSGQALDIERDRVQRWWRRWGEGSQAEVGPVRALILAALPLTLRRLDVHENSDLQIALQRVERAQRTRVQASAGSELQAAADNERRALDCLASLIEMREHSGFLRDRVRERIERSGYTAESTLLELVQNADDALAQAREIARGKLSEAARRVVVRVNEDIERGRPTIDLIHFGRPINDTGDAEFAAMQDRQWDQDLYFMMLMDLTTKPGESSESGATASTTGCFGLGFKSVHLISDAPSVVSRFIAFSIAGGVLPKEEQVPDDEDLQPVEDRHVTRVRLPLRSDVSGDDLVTRMFRRFHVTLPLLPAFAREIREIVVEGGPFPGVSVFDGVPVGEAPGWTASQTSLELADGVFRFLRFRPDGSGTSTLVLGIRDGEAVPFPEDLPFLWNVTPTNERWGCGYAVSGPFQLDHGRTHVALDHENTRRVAKQLGEALGKGLVALHEALANNAGPSCGLPGREGVATFTASLWKVLSSGIDTEDTLRRDFLRCLHGPGRGVSAWMGVCSVVPSKLPAPFREQLPALVSDMRIEWAAQDRALWRAVAEIEDLARLAGSHLVVSNAVAERLRRLLPNEIRELRRLEPTDVFTELAETWDHLLTSDRLHALRPLANEHVWKLIGAEDNRHRWSAKCVARSAAGTLVPLSELLVPSDLNLNDETHASLAAEADEPKRAAFAPDTHVLDRAYISAPEDAAMFRNLRARLQIDAATMAAWFIDLADTKRTAALRYLLHGRLKSEVLEKLVPSDARPSWLSDREAVWRMVDGLGEDWQCHSLLAALFPEHGRNGPETPSTRHPRPEDFFERLQDWWNDPTNRKNVLDHYERAAWPDWLRKGKAGIAESLRTGSDDHWLALLVLGACQGLGRSQPKQHRGFLEAAHRERRWTVFRNPDKHASWMRLLDKWHDNAVDHLGHVPWMSLFPTIYLLSRYLNVYRRLLRTAPQRQNLDPTELLSPRSDSALSGAGGHFDAPPVPVKHGLHWILRELVRLDVLERKEHLLPYCWVPSEQVFRFLGPFGLESPDGNASNSDKARAVYDFLTPRLRTTPHLHYAFDIPLRHVDSNEDLRRDFGLQD